MATTNDVLTAFNKVGAWPHMLPTADKALELATVWAGILDDVDGALVEPALRDHARTSSFDPRPADVMRWIGERLAAQWPTAGAVYDLLRKHAKAETAHMVAPSVNPAPDPLPVDLGRVYEACGGRRALLDENQAAARANVRETLKWFEAAARREFFGPGGAAGIVAVAGLPVADPSRQLPPALLPAAPA
jgi:hypothetical protein